VQFRKPKHHLRLQLLLPQTKVQVKNVAQMRRHHGLFVKTSRSPLHHPHRLLNITTVPQRILLTTFLHLVNALETCIV
jgi:hypothetical protein